MLNRLIFLLLGVVVSTAAATGAAQWKHYCNAKYDYCVDYPAFLNAMPEADAGDGDQFASPKSALKMRVWATWSNWMNGDDMTLGEQRDWDLKNLKGDMLPDAKVTYRPLGKNWYVLSGTSKNNVFYQRTTKLKDAFVTVLLIYPQANKKQFDTAVEHIAASVK